MIIKKKRIRTLDGILGFVPEGSNVAVAIKDPLRFKEVIEKIGFSFPLNEGDSMLPSPSFGKVSQVNAEGSFIIHKDQPMETAYRVAEWHWKEWSGRYDTTDNFKLVDVPYKRYPRTFVSPFAVEITALKNTKGELMLVSPFIVYSDENKALLTHTINLFLEIFGECQILTDDLKELVKSQIRKLNWRILPVGKMPWEQLSKQLKPLVDLAKEGNRPFILHRLEKVYGYTPDFTAVGTAGFKGYVIFGFPNKNIYLCESIYYGNATYVFAEKWEDLSKRTKAEILSANLQKDRIIHRVNQWDKRIEKLLT